MRNKEKQNNSKTIPMYVVRSISLVNWLCQRGYKLLKAEDSKEDSKYKVFMFEDSEEIRSSVATYLSERKKV